MSQNSLILYGYWRSSASWRVRWALEHKGIDYEYVAVNLLKGEHRAPANMARNPSGLVPSLQLEDGKTYLSQSMAILNFLEEAYPAGARLFPQDPIFKAQVIGLCEIINADTAPLQKPLVFKKHSASEEEGTKWAQHWIREGLSAFDRASAPLRGAFSFGNTSTAADMLLVPQIYNALRYNLDVANEFPALNEIYKESFKLEACQKSSPEAQKDAVP